MDRSPEHFFLSMDSLAKARAPSDNATPLGEIVMFCDDHGSYPSNGVRYFGKREIWTKCPACEDARLARERQAQAQEQAARARARLEELLETAAIPPRFVGRTLDNFRATTDAQTQALEVARDFAQNFEQHAKRGSNLILSGLPGTGKSHLATAILQAVMPQHCGLYTTCMNVIRAVRGTWRKDSERSETEVLNAYADVPLLVLDEIGVQYGTDGEQTILFDVLDRRYREMRPSIFLTNQDKQGFKEFIGERTFDRLTETSRWVPFDWPSYRPQARKETA
jgi:DNA replication protein DnaC